MFCFLINGWCQIVSEGEPERASGRVCLCVSVCLRVCVLCACVFQAAASGCDPGVNHTTARTTTGSIATTATTTLLLSVSVSFSFMLSVLAVFLFLSRTYNVFPTLSPTYMISTHCFTISSGALPFSSFSSSPHNLKLSPFLWPKPPLRAS